MKLKNLSVAVMPTELQPWIFRYGVAMPFYNVGHTVRTVSRLHKSFVALVNEEQIIFNTKNEIARNLGILLAWIVLSFITISVATWLIRRNSVNAHRKAVGENELDEKVPGSENTV